MLAEAVRYACQLQQCHCQIQALLQVLEATTFPAVLTTPTRLPQQVRRFCRLRDAGLLAPRLIATYLDPVGLLQFYTSTLSVFLSRDAMHQRGLCRDAVSVWPDGCSSRSYIVSKRLKKATVAMECTWKSEPKFSNGTIFNDPERPLTQFSRSSHYSTLNISERVRDRDIVTMEC